MAKRARPELHASPVPGDHTAFGDQTGGCSAGRGKARRAIELDAVFELRQRGFNLVHRILRAKKRGRHANVADFAGLRRAEQRRAERRAIVAGSGLDVDFIEQTRFEQAAVGRAVQRHTTRQSQPPRPGAAAPEPADVKHHTVQTFLQGGGDVAMVAGDLVLRPARRYQTPSQVLPRSGVVFTLVPGPVLHQHRDADGTVRAQLDSVVEEGSKAARIAIRSQSHDLVLV